MTFAEIQFPSDISYGAAGGPAYSTDVVETFGGYEQRNINWADARGKWNVAHGVKTLQQLDELIAFFRARQGKAIGFRFKDWSDYKVEGATIGTGDGTTTTFQLKKQYISGADTAEREIKKPIQGTISVYIDGSPLEITTEYTVNYTTGEISILTPPSNGEIITADFEFDVPVRFDTDALSISLDNFEIGSWSNIPIVEIRL
nr:glycoside hydrolase family 24 [bacterium]